MSVGTTSTAGKLRAELERLGDAVGQLRGAADGLSSKVVAAEAARDAAVARERDLRAELERLHSWDGLMELLDEHWPDDIFPTLPDDARRDPGPRIASLLRWLAVEHKAHAVLRARFEALVDEFEDPSSQRTVGAWLSDLRSLLDGAV